MHALMSREGFNPPSFLRILVMLYSCDSCDSPGEKLPLLISQVCRCACFRRIAMVEEGMSASRGILNVGFS